MSGGCWWCVTLWTVFVRPVFGDELRCKIVDKCPQSGLSRKFYQIARGDFKFSRKRSFTLKNDVRRAALSAALFSVFQSAAPAYHGADNRLAPLGHFGQGQNRLLQGAGPVQFVRLPVIALGYRNGEHQVSACQRQAADPASGADRTGNKQSPRSEISWHRFPGYGRIEL